HGVKNKSGGVRLLAPVGALVTRNALQVKSASGGNPDRWAASRRAESRALDAGVRHRHHAAAGIADQCRLSPHGFGRRTAPRPAVKVTRIEVVGKAAPLRLALL